MNIKLLLSALALAAAAFFISRARLTDGSTSDGDSPPGSKPAPAPLIVETATTLAQAVSHLPESIDKRKKVLSMIDAAQTPAELEQLMKDFAGDPSAEASLAARWAMMDPEGGFAWLRLQMSDGGYASNHIREAFFRTWASNDPVAAMKAAMEAQMMPGMEISSLEVVEAVLQKDLKAGGKLLAERGKFPDIFTFPDNLWKVDPAGFVKALLPEGVTPDRKLGWALAEPLKAWSRKSPADVQKWLEALSPAALAQLLPHAIVGLATSNPAAASELVARVPQAAAREAAAASLAREWVTTDPANAFAYAVTAGVEKSKYTLKKMSETLIEKGDAAILQAFNQLPAGKVRNAVLPILANAWLDQNPTGASQFLAALPPSPERNDAMKWIAKTWTEDAPQEALKFLERNPGPELDEVFHRIVARHAGDDPPSAAKWSAQQQPAERALAAIRTTFNMMSTEYQIEDAAAMVVALPTPQMQTEAVRSFMEPFGTGQRLFDEGLKWAAALPPDLRAVARETILASTLITPGERARAQDQLK
jgi:hypothetical protein